METTKTVNTELWKINGKFIGIGKEETVPYICQHTNGCNANWSDNAELIVTAVNACKQINAANPLKVAAGLPKLFEVLYKVINDKKLPMSFYIELSSIADTLTSDF